MELATITIEIDGNPTPAQQTALMARLNNIVSEFRARVRTDPRLMLWRPTVTTERA